MPGISTKATFMSFINALYQLKRHHMYLKTHPNENIIKAFLRNSFYSKIRTFQLEILCYFDSAKWWKNKPMLDIHLYLVIMKRLPYKYIM